MKTQSKRLHRRKFIQTSSAALLGFGLFNHLNVSASSTGATISQRRIFPLNHNWRYSDTVSDGATGIEFDDSKFERVTIPHTGRILPWNGFDDKSYQFVSIYRRHFKLPNELKAQRVFIDFDGVMTACSLWINGERLGEHRGGYTTFSFELTSHFNWKGNNVLAVEVDSTERPDIPPFGGNIDYLTFGGIYRDVALRVVAATFIENVFAKPVNVLSKERRLDVRCFINRRGELANNLKLTVELRDGERVLATQSKQVSPSNAPYEAVSLTDLGSIELWELTNPKLYRVSVRLSEGDRVIDHYVLRTGFREVRFTPEGFLLNGKHLKLRGLNRHQTFPYVGPAMPERVQRRDAEILKRELKCNIVRTSHYPQSPYFLDACDELGLLVFEEIPGWGHIGDQPWKELAVRNVEAMIRRDWNHPSIILWGVRINESRDDHDFYSRTNKLAHELDDSRQTGGVRLNYGSELLEDVFTVNDFGFPLRPPNHPLYLNTEFVGHTYPTKRNDNVERVTEQMLRHARVHNQIASDKRYAGGLGWCAFDYNTHANFGSGDRICYHGVSDIFRIPKPAAGFYKSQCDPKEEVVLEPAFYWARGDHNESFEVVTICSNCEQLKIYISDRLVAEVEPDKETFPNLQHPPFIVNIDKGIGRGWGDLRMDGYINGQKVISKTLSGKGIDQEFRVEPDDLELIGDGIDATRVVMKVTDEFGAIRSFAASAIWLEIEGPGEIIGDNPFALIGGAGAIWIKTKEASGTIRIKAKHSRLGVRRIAIQVRPMLGEKLSYF